MNNINQQVFVLSLAVCVATRLIFSGGVFIQGGGVSAHIDALIVIAFRGKVKAWEWVDEWVDGTASHIRVDG